jgi:alpha-L-rhamnosidase
MVGIFLSVVFVSPAATAIKNLRLEYMKNPIGIDNLNPQFSWQMHSDETGQRQTAYQLTLLAADKTTGIWTSGKVVSDISTGVKCTGATLSPSTRYYWKVSVWDKNDTEISSVEDAFFETGLLDSGWSGAQWLKAAPKSIAVSSHFTLEADVTVVNDNAAIIFSAANTSLFYMWSINTHDDANEPLLRRHFYNGNFSVSDVKFGQHYSKAGLINHERHLKIDITGNVIKTYIDNVLIDTYTATETNLVPSGVGFRAFKEPGLDEKAYWDNIVLTNYVDGQPEIVLSEDFETGNNFFCNGETALVNGNTKLYCFSSNGESRIFDDSFDGIPMFRTGFTLSKTIKSARIYSSALGIYDLFVNGQRVGTPQADGTTVYDELKPGWTDYRKTVFYSTYDITGLLLNGPNAVGAEVASGWFNGNIAHNEYGNHPLAFIAKIRIEYTDGTSETFVTNTAGWKVSTYSPIRIADIYDGETYDARKESAWTSPAFDDSGWSSTAVNDYFKGEILAFTGRPVQVRPALEQTPETITVYNGTKSTGATFGEINIVRTITGAESIVLQKGETALYDFGQNMVGWIKFKVKGERGTKMRGRFAEMLNDTGESSRGNDNAKGTLYLQNLRSAKATLNYTLKGDEQGETFNPTMTFFGFRYCEITASADITVETMQGEVVGNANEENSSFVTNNELVNRLYANVIWGQRGNFLSVPTDCPQRDERLGWMGDTQIFSRAATYNADVVSFFRKWAKDVRDSQQPDGSYPSVVPDNWNVGYGRTAWAEAGIIVPWNVYLMYGDREMLSEHYASMEKFMDWMAEQKSGTYLYNGGDTQYGDWLAYENTDARFISVCYYACVARLMTKISNALSELPNDIYAQNATKYQTLYNNIKAEFQTRYVSRTGLLSINTQTAYLLALQNDLFSNAENTQKAINHLVEKITANGNKLSTGFVGTGILNQTLSEYGATNTAYNLLLQRNNPSWLYSVDQGATTIWERWNSYTLANGFGDPGMNSFNHYSYGAVSEWMFRCMAGIEADENHPGFKHFTLQPVPDTRDVPFEERITEVDATFGSYYGAIGSRWEQKADGNYTYAFTVPANTTARLYIPKTKDVTHLKQAEIPAANAPGVTSFTDEGDRFVLELESGNYVFDTDSKNESGYVGISSLLDEIVSFESVALYPDYTCRQQSSYDRRSVSPGNANWFANDDGFGFIRTETNDGRTEKVLFEDTGAGAITRIWMTTQNRNGTLRFYFDGNTTAGWTIPAYDMLQAGLGLGLGLCQPHINNETGGKGGSSFFFPITYAQSCKVTLEEPSPTFSTPRYYQFNYRKYPDGTSVEPFSTATVAALAGKIQSVNGQLLNPPTFSAGTNTNGMKRLAPGDSITITLPQGTNIVRTLQIAVSSFGESEYKQLMRGLVLEALFDGVQTVWTPLGDFSGGGMGAPSVESWYLTSNGSGNIVSRWVMPYQNGGEIRIVNYSGYDADIYLQANTDNYTWQENSLYFHASWRQQTEIPLTKWDNGADYLDWNFATLNGRGVYRGDVLTLFNRSPRWYGEGDEKIFVDGETFPSHFGTGTEDYYNCSWAPVTPFQTPFGGAPRADNISSHGYNTFFRTRNLDAIPFAEKLKFDIEMLSWDSGMADYATTVFWYGDSDAVAEGTSGKEEATRELLPNPPAAFDYIIPNSFEFEELETEYISPSIRTEKQTMTPFQGKWSKAAQLLCRDAQTNDYLLYRFEGYNSAKRYRIQVQGTKAVDYGILGFSVNGSSPYTVDFYNNGVIHTGVILLGSRFSPDPEGVFEVKITYNGKNQASTGNLIGLDCIQFIEEDFKVAGAIEFETLNFTNKSGFTNNFPQGMGNYPNGKWSNKTQQVFQGGKKDDYIDYTFGNMDAGKNYQLTLYATKGPDFATLSFAVNGETLPVRFDGFHELVHDSGPIELGEFAAKNDGAIDFRVNVTGTNPYSYQPYYIVGLDCILLEKKSDLALKNPEENKLSYRIIDRKLLLQKKAVVEIFDLNGRKIILANNLTNIDLSGLRDLFYILKIYSMEESLTDKICLIN